MARRGEIIVQNAEILLAPGAGARYKRRVHSAAQRGWQISGEVVVPAAQLWLDTAHRASLGLDSREASDLTTNFADPGTFGRA